MNKILGEDVMEENGGMLIAGKKGRALERKLLGGVVAGQECSPVRSEPQRREEMAHYVRLEGARESQRELKAPVWAQHNSAVSVAQGTQGGGVKCFWLHYEAP